jgi:broad specificity phosphatase PhoE
MLLHELKEKDDELREMRAAAQLVKLPVVKVVPIADGGAPTDGSSLVVHFVRHGQAAHNVFAAQWRLAHREGNCYTSPECPVDPDLTADGRNDALRAGAELAKRLRGSSVAVASSPMRRTLETWELAKRQLKKDAAHRVVVVDDARERFGLHICDSLREYDRAKDFPNVDWSLAANASADPAKIDAREPYTDLLLRGVRLLETLRGLKETELVVFSHSSFLLALFNGVLQAEDEALRAPFTTGEVRSTVITFH